MRRKKLLGHGIFLAMIFAVSSFALDSEDCLFYAPFEGDVRPRIHRGPGELAQTAEVRFTEGMRGKAVLIGGLEKPSGGSGLVYFAKGNFNPSRGSIAFWAKCVGETNFASNGGYYTFLNWGTGPYAWMFYRFGAGGNTGGLVQERGQTIFVNWGYATTWDAEIWNHIVFTWQPGESRWYVNGKLINRITEGVPNSSEMSEHVGVGTDGQSAAAIDELYFFRRPLSDYEVSALYLLGSGKIEPPLVVAPRTDIPPTIDGNVTGEEWARANSFTGLVDEAAACLWEDGIKVSVTYDTENLYLAFEQSFPEIVRTRPDFFPGGPLRRSVTAHDAELLEDDSYEVEIVTSDAHSFLIAANALGTILDSRDGDASWESAASVKGSDDLDRWTLEMSIPFGALGIKAEPGVVLGLNLARNLRVLKNTRLVWSAPGSPGILRLGADEPIVRLSSLGLPSTGAYDVRLEVVSRAERTQEVAVSIGIPPEAPIEKKFELAANASETVTESGRFSKPTEGVIQVGAVSGETAIAKFAIPFSFAPLLQAAKYFYPSEDVLEVEIDRTAIGWEGLSAEVALTRPGEEAPLASGIIREFLQDKEIARLDTSKVEPGKYDVRILLTGKDGHSTSLKLDFEKLPKPPWLGNKVGVTDAVPIPWTPVEVSGTKINLWGREMDFGEAVFFRQMTSNGKELLSRPVALVVRTAGKEMRFDQGQVSVTNQTPKKVELAGSARLEGVELTTKTLVEYDGFTFTEVTLTPVTPIEVESLDLEIPFKAQYARLFFSGAYGGQYTGAIPAEGWKSPHGPAFQWVGDVDSGIQFYYQDQVNWIVKRRDLQAEIMRREGEVVYRVPLIDTVTTLEKPTTFSFGLMATPVKPRHPKWRLWWTGYTPLKNQIALSLWYSDWGEGDNIPRIAPSQMTGREAGGVWSTVRENYEKGIITTPYVSGQVAWAFAPEYQQFQEEWRTVPSERITVKEDEPKNWWKAGMVCPESSFKDFWLFEMSRTVKYADFHGLYFDNMFAASCANVHHGCGAVDREGKVLPRLPLFGTREWLERTYVMMKEYDPESVIVYHMSGTPWMPYCSFSDLMMPGEQYASGLGTRLSGGLADNYYDILTLEHMQAEFMGHNWGPACGLLTEFAAPTAIHGYPNRIDARPSRYFEDGPQALREINHVVGMLLLHDSVLPWPYQCNPLPFIQARRAQINFGWDEKIEFIPYWNNPYVELEAGGVEPVVCSIFRRPGRAMFVVMNNSDSEAEVTISIDYGALGFRPENNNNLTDGVTGAMFGYKKDTDTVTFPVGARAYRVLVTGGQIHDVF